MRDLDVSNFRDVAKKAIAKYADTGMILDALLWGRIVGLYEQAIATASENATKKESR